MFWKSENSIEKIKKKSGTDNFVSIFGKSTVSEDSDSYMLAREVTKYLIEKNYGVIHGGYAGGIMQAVADQAYETLTELNLPAERNIAIPQRQHDSVGWARVENATFAKTAVDVYCRLRTMISNSDFVIVAPRGGDGTMLELVTTWHENVIAEAVGLKPVPVVVLQTKDGTDWRAVFSTLTEKLDNSTTSPDDLKWLHFTEDINSFSEVERNL